MKIGIIGALSAEVKTIAAALENPSHRAISGAEYITGGLCGHEVTVTCCSVGKVNAAMAAEAMCAVVGADCVINSGVAGNASPDLRALDVVLSRDAAFHDVDPALWATFPPHSWVFAADEHLLQTALSACGQIDDRDYACVAGRVATGDRFVRSARERDDIVARVNPLCVEMEGAAVGQVCAMNGVPFLVIRAISDNADSEAELSFEEFLPRAADNAAKILLKMIELL